MKQVIFFIFIMNFFIMPFAFADSQVRQFKTPTGTFVTLSATEKKKVLQDLLVVNMSFVQVNNNAQGDVNKAIKKAMDLASPDGSIKVKTVVSSNNNSQNNVVNSFPTPQPVSNAPVPPQQASLTNVPPSSIPQSSSTSPINAEQQKGDTALKEAPTIELQSSNSKKLLEVIGKMKDLGFKVNWMNYTLSPELEETQKNELLVIALKKIKSRAALVSKTLDKSGYEVADVNVDSSHMQPPLYSMIGQVVDPRMMGNGVPPPIEISIPLATPSETEVIISVSARIKLKP